MTFIWAPLDHFILYLAAGWQFANGAHEPHAHSASYAVLLWKPAAEALAGAGRDLTKHLEVQANG